MSRNFLILPGHISIRYPVLKCLLCALAIGALFTLVIALIDRAEARRHPEQVTRMRYQESINAPQ